MTYLFFMKMLDDAQRTTEANANAFGIKVKDPVFREGDWHNPDTDRDVPYNTMRWHVFKNLDPETMFKVVSRDAFSFIKNLNEGKESAYSRFMQNATFLIQSPRTLKRIVECIDNLDMNNRDTMGDVYEYILGKMAASGNNGQFRTPRHIIRMMVELMQPSLKDSVCDPAMGSAGFIVETAKYVQDKYKNELLKRENAEHYKREMLHGFDTDATMLRIGAMNLMLHGVDNPDPVAWDNVSLKWLEKVRLDLRDLVKFLIGSQNQKFVIDIDDVVIDEGTSEGITFTVSYKQKVMDFLRENRNLPVLRKIYNLQQLSSDDINELERIPWKELGNKEEYDKLTNGMAYGANVAPSSAP